MAHSSRRPIGTEYEEFIWSSMRRTEDFSESFGARSICVPDAQLWQTIPHSAYNAEGRFFWEVELATLRISLQSLQLQLRKNPEFFRRAGEGLSEVHRGTVSTDDRPRASVQGCWMVHQRLREQGERRFGSGISQLSSGNSGNKIRGIHRAKDSGNCGFRACANLDYTCSFHPGHELVAIRPLYRQLSKLLPEAGSWPGLGIDDLSLHKVNREMPRTQTTAAPNQGSLQMA